MSSSCAPVVALVASGFVCQCLKKICYKWYRLKPSCCCWTTFETCCLHVEILCVIKKKVRRTDFPHLPRPALMWAGVLQNDPHMGNSVSRKVIQSPPHVSWVRAESRWVTAERGPHWGRKRRAEVMVRAHTLRAKWFHAVL